MHSPKTIRTALISVFHKDNLEPIIRKLHSLGIHLLSTGGTQKFIADLGVPVKAVEELTTYPSILDGRVKTLHPKVFGGILARREFTHLVELDQLDIPEIDLVIVDLYPFEQTVATTDDEDEIIEKIDIGGISLIRAAAKNYKDVLIIPSRADYHHLLELLETRNGVTFEIERKQMARRAFSVSADYDDAIFNYFDSYLGSEQADLENTVPLRYGENPHQNAVFYGDLDDIFEKLHGKDLSYNNLVDVDAAVNLIHEFRSANPTFAVIKHTNACGLATRPTLLEAWNAAFACDTTSAFGGILCANTTIDAATATEIDKLFFEIIIAPAFDDAALDILQKKKNRIILIQKQYEPNEKHYKSLLNGTLEQEADLRTETVADLKTATKRAPSEAEIKDLLFANICAKHLKSNTIALVKNNQLIGMGCGQTSRVDALQQAIAKSKSFGFDLAGAVMASDAFFPFADCVEIAHKAGITAVVHPGGSMRDQDSIDFCDANGMAIAMTGTRHFKH
jgi:phosphoribosylaminoimidazolecarboxamide formyltransferase / IMP cyclohydrolase